MVTHMEARMHIIIRFVNGYWSVASGEQLVMSFASFAEAIAFVDCAA
jgi:hypothetical protein